MLPSSSVRLACPLIRRVGISSRRGAVLIVATGARTATAIYFLLRAGERSHWHRVDADEIWLHHLGSPLRLAIDDTDHLLGPDRPQILVPAHAWQAAEPTGEFTLVSCIVVPGFEFTGFELAPPGWQPG